MFFFIALLYNVIGDDMKRKIIDSSIELIKKNKNYDEEQLEIIAYGLEGIYLTITKMVILFLLAYLLNIVKEFVILLITFNIIRSQAFGIHASKSIYCLISSTLLFIGGTLICKYIVLPYWLIIICAIICDICLFLYAPADTYKRPIVNKKKRKRFKILSFVLGIIYTILLIIYKDSFISNYLIIGMINSVIMILPITYKIFNLPYDNYKTYEYGV